MTRRGFGAVFVLGIASAPLGCITKKAELSSEAEAAGEGLKQFEVARLPEEGFTRHYVDFEGKVQLLGYSFAGADAAPPGSSVSLTLYWQRLGSLGAGWNLFTHILGERGGQLSQQDSSGPLRESAGGPNQTYGPSQWELGKIYKDELNLRIPGRAPGIDRPLSDSRVAIAVGVWKGARTRLNVVSGYGDNRHRAIILDLATGVVRRAPTPEEVANPTDSDEPKKK